MNIVPGKKNNICQSLRSGIEIMNVFKYYKKCYNWKNPLNWWRLQGYWCRAIKYGWQRATRGFSDYDLWALSEFYLKGLSNSLKYFTENRHGSPDTEHDKWTKKYLEIADCFYRATEENEYYKNEWKEDYFDSFDDDFVLEKMKDGCYRWVEKEKSDEIKDLRQAYHEREEEIQKLRDNDMKEGFDKLKDVFWGLWD